MPDTKLEDLEECDAVTRQLNQELRILINAKYDGDRKLFRRKKHVVALLLRTLMKDIRSMAVR